jgi:two-component system, NtrC family, sensor histidine kinase HydH
MSRRLFFAVFVAISIVTTLLSSFLSYRNANRAAEHFLRSYALGIATNLETMILKYGTRENLFVDIITKEGWQGIAFLALYTRDGLTVLHSNENLINKRIKDQDIRLTAETGRPISGYTTLGTGEEVFVLNFPVHSRDSTMVLRVALHTYLGRVIVRDERFQLYSVLVVVSFLTIITVLFMILSRKREELEKALIEREKLSLIGEMATILAHEIRNPLGSIKGFAQYLREQGRGEKTQDKVLAMQYLDIIISESRRIEALTGDLLSYARQEDVKREHFGLRDIVQEALFSLDIPQRISLHVDIPGDALIFSDKAKMRQILTNLLLNAVDSVEESGTIRISAIKDKEGITIQVMDTGTGIDEEAMDKIFRPFYTTKTKGTGLGLSIVERFVRALGGRIRVESVPGSGSTFSVTMPGD